MDWDDLVVLGNLWLVHSVVTMPVVLPIVWLSRRSVRWQWWETTVFVVPFAVWLILFYRGDMPKTLANLGEAFYISAAISAAVMIRVVVARVSENRIVPMLLITSAAICAAVVYYATPMWPEV